MVTPSHKEIHHDQHHPPHARPQRRPRRCRSHRRARRRAGADAPLAHGDVVAEAPAGPGHVGRARRRAHRRTFRRPLPDHGLRRRRGRAGVRGARCRRHRRRRDGPHRFVLLAGQGAGRGVLHHGAVRAHARRARRLDRRRRRTGFVGRALRAVRRQAVHGRQHRRVHGRLVPPRDQEPRRCARPQAALARPRRRSLSPARRRAADDAAGRNPGRAAIRRDRRRRVRRPRHRHRARALSRGDALLRPRLQQAERHRRMHRLAQGVGDARQRRQGDRRARLRRRGLVRARRDGAA